MNRNIFVKVVTILSLLSIFASTIGCIGTGFSSRNSFARLSQEEKQQYVKDYLKETYGVDYEISEIKKRQIDVFSNEKHYFATASYKEQKFSFWVSDDGEIYDTGFCLELSDKVDELLSSIVSKYWDNYYIHDFFVFGDLYTRKWTKDDDMNEMFKKESIMNYISLFLDSSNDRDDDLLLLEQLESELSNFEGSICVYYCDNPKDIDMSLYDMNSCDVFIDLH